MKAALVLLLSVCMVARDTTHIRMERLLPFSVMIAGGVVMTQLAQQRQYWKVPAPFTVNTGDDYRYAANADKFGHGFAAYAITVGISQGLWWSGVDTTVGIWIAAAVALTNQTIVEYRDATHVARDGSSVPYLGWSWGDMLANMVGALLPVAQHYYRADSRFIEQLRYKFSLHSAGNVERGYFQSILDDYESQYHWLCFPLGAVLGGEQSWWKDAFGIGLGHSVRGTVGTGGAYTFTGTHELWVTLDYNLEAIPVESPLVRSLLRIVNLVRLPAPCARIVPGVAVFGFRW